MRTRLLRRKDFAPAKPHVKLTTGDVISMLRELKSWTQEELARRSGVSSTNLSLLENNKLDIGKRRAIAIAKAFDVHPAIIMFPEYEAQAIANAA
jgi:transcriptional regulator with XRE-family HTH domain